MDAVDPLARSIAILGLILSAVGVIIATATYLRDRSHLTVTLQRNMHFVFLGHQDEMKQLYQTLERAAESLGARAIPIPPEFARRDPNKVWAFVKLVNDGRRPITFQKAGVYVPSEERPFFAAVDSEVKHLEEGDHLEVPIDEQFLKDVRVLCAFAQDVSGRLYFSTVPWNMSGILFRIRRLLRIPLAKTA